MADGAEIAKAWVTIIPSAKGMGKGIESELGGIGETGGKKASKGFLGGMGGVIGGVGKVALGAVGIVGGAIAGMAIAGGVSRALNIEDAQAKLSGLGHSAKAVEGIMNNASASVKGTAFGLGDAAAVAAGAVAAGVKPGQDLERTLKLMGDGATIAGSTMGEMGAIFNKVASSDMVQGDVLAQLGDRGIPILQLLGDEMGKSSAEVKKLASAGKIDFATFQNAMEKGMGGAALKSGDTFKGSLANTKAALSRIGETIVVPFLTMMQQGMGVLIPVLDGINGALKPVMAAFGEWASSNLPILITEISGGFKAMGAAFSDGEDEITSSGLAGFLEGIGVAARNVVDAVGPTFSEISGGVQAMAAAFMDGEDHITSSGLAGIFEGIGVSARNAVDVFAAGWEALGPSVMALIPQILQLVSSISPLGLIFQMIAPFLPQIAEMLMGIAAAVVQVLGVIIPLVQSILSQLMPVFMQLVGAVLPPVIAIVGLLVAAIGPLVSILGPILTGVINALMPVVITVFGLIQTVITTVLGVVQGIIGAFTAALSGDWSTFWDSIGSIFSTILGGIATFAAQFFGELPGKILGALGDLGGLLLGAGGQIMKGLLDGLLAGFGKVKDFVGGIGSWIADNKGPKAYDLALLVPAGGWIMDGLGSGIEDSMPALGSTLSDVSWMIQNGIDPELEAGVSARVSAAVPAMAGAVSSVAPDSVAPAAQAAAGGVTFAPTANTTDPDEVIQELWGKFEIWLRETGQM
ncbi:hypothetical protein BLJ79_21620 [Arthrobacter sp. UCD-GKA]|uniref:phage tail protein n=1 Tax=Arthrobacter sp. UCD-GKA TaxID=1913576 RepID=UPI0008DD8418|nr:tape measure protein [Arthrobacter sp. UCD-GKA]OIH81960.1 hypothetical protein BLJ79_21620 [Arthrobacter sp. UCD-GKA]